MGVRRYGLLVVPMFTGSDTSRFATEIQRGIRDVEARHPCGWIIDLRGDRGGNMWAMLAGVGPIAGDGMLREFMDREGKVGTGMQWFYKNGRAWSGLKDGTPMGGLDVADLIAATAEHSPVAVLIDQATGSSGDAIAFEKRPEPVFLGQRRWKRQAAPNHSL